MKYDQNKSFGYPVLTEDSDDYLNSTFKVEFTFNINSKNISQFNLAYEFECDVPELLELIKNGSVSYWVRVVCRSTFYSKMFNATENGEILIDGNILRDAVECYGFILSNSNNKLKTKRINTEYGYDEFNIKNGQILAMTPPSLFMTDKDFWKPISSIFEYMQDEELKDGEFTIDLEEDFVQIFSNTKQLNKFKQFEKSNDGKLVLINTVFMSSIIKMIELLNEKPEDYEEKKWAKILLAKASAKDVSLDNRKSFVAAQKILDRPFAKLSDIFLEK